MNLLVMIVITILVMIVMIVSNLIVIKKATITDGLHGRYKVICDLKKNYKYYNLSKD